MNKYEQVANDLRKKIFEGQFLPNEQLPFEKDLCQKYNASRITIKRAVDQLVFEGLVIKRRGSGTFIKNLNIDSDGKNVIKRQLTGVYRNKDRENIVSKVLNFEIIKPPYEVAEKLQISSDDLVYYSVRYRHDDKNWASIEYTYMPVKLIKGLNEDVLRKSIYTYIEKKLGLRIQSAHRIVTAIKPNEIEKEYLNMENSDPILSIEQIGYLDNGQPFEYSNSHHRGDNCQFRAVSIK